MSTKKIGKGLHRLDAWEHLIGTPNMDNRLLTKPSLEKWARSSRKVFECSFCGTRGTLHELSIDGISVCPQCKEYKGLQPYIPVWSDWGK